MYFYGVKVCENESVTEDTLFIENSTYGDMNPIIVYPKKSKGGINGKKIIYIYHKMLIHFSLGAGLSISTNSNIKKTISITNNRAHYFC